MNQIVLNRHDSESAGRRAREFRVQVLSRSGERRWDDFVQQEPGGTVYHLSGWRRIFEDQLHHPSYYLYCERGGVIEGVLPLVHVKSRLFCNALISIPFLVYGGPLYISDAAQQGHGRVPVAVDESRHHYAFVAGQRLPGSELSFIFGFSA